MSELEASSPQTGDRRGQLIIACSVLTGMGTLFVMMRMFSRGVVIRALGKDDWTMFVAWCGTVTYLAFIIASAANGSGMRKANQKPEWLEPVLKYVLAIEAVYYVCVYAIKCSILLFYLRLVHGRGAKDFFKRASLYTIYLLSVFLVICITVVFTQCTPLKKAWMPIQYHNRGHCMNGTAFFYSTSAFNIVTDIWILVLPLKLVWGVQRAKFEKFALLAVFAMGAFACIASCIRLYTIKVFTQSSEQLYDSVPINIWSMIEINVAIICASVPALKGLAGARALRKGIRGQTTGASGFGSGAGTNLKSAASTTSDVGRLSTSETPLPLATLGAEQRGYGYGVGIVCGKRADRNAGERASPASASASSTRSRGGIGYQRDVEVRIEKGDMAEDELNLSVNVEQGEFYGTRPGGR
ncbi:hypothetical protein DFH27DRAFT_139799 [Peziza echinospora]|nr:hypothetical protein DFH27DRAFT_139799 [Peziza echinospora]